MVVYLEEMLEKKRGERGAGFNREDLLQAMKDGARLRLRPGAVWVGRFSPDGQTVATGSLDGTARLWDVASGLPLMEPLRHPAGVLRIAFSPDGRRLLTYGGERARIREVLRAPAPVPPWFPELIEAVAGMRWMPDGQFVPASPEPIERMRLELAEARPTDFYRRWARWFLVGRIKVPSPHFDSAGETSGGDAPLH